MKKCMVFNIGCIECGVSSGVVAIYGDESVANGLAHKLNGVAGWREGGQNSYEVFELPDMDVIAEEYKEYLEEEK